MKKQTLIALLATMPFFAGCGDDVTQGLFAEDVERIFSEKQKEIDERLAKEREALLVEIVKAQEDAKESLEILKGAEESMGLIDKLDSVDQSLVSTRAKLSTILSSENLPEEVRADILSLLEVDGETGLLKSLAELIKSNKDAVENELSGLQTFATDTEDSLNDVINNLIVLEGYVGTADSGNLADLKVKVEENGVEIASVKSILENLVGTQTVDEEGNISVEFKEGSLLGAMSNALRETQIEVSQVEMALTGVIDRIGTAEETLSELPSILSNIDIGLEASSALAKKALSDLYGVPASEITNENFNSLVATPGSILGSLDAVNSRLSNVELEISSIKDAIYGEIISKLAIVSPSPAGYDVLTQNSLIVDAGSSIPLSFEMTNPNALPYTSIVPSRAKLSYYKGEVLVGTPVMQDLVLSDFSGTCMNSGPLFVLKRGTPAMPSTCFLNLNQSLKTDIAMAIGTNPLADMVQVELGEISFSVNLRPVLLEITEATFFEGTVEPKQVSTLKTDGLVFRVYSNLGSELFRRDLLTVNINNPQDSFFSIKTKDVLNIDTLEVVYKEASAFVPPNSDNPQYSVGSEVSRESVSCVSNTPLSGGQTLWESCTSNLVIPEGHGEISFRLHGVELFKQAVFLTTNGMYQTQVYDSTLASFSQGPVQDEYDRTSDGQLIFRTYLPYNVASPTFDVTLGQLGQVTINTYDSSTIIGDPTIDICQNTVVGEQMVIECTVLAPVLPDFREIVIKNSQGEIVETFSVITNTTPEVVSAIVSNMDLTESAFLQDSLAGIGSDTGAYMPFKFVLNNVSANLLRTNGAGFRLEKFDSNGEASANPGNHLFVSFGGTVTLVRSSSPEPLAGLENQNLVTISESGGLTTVEFGAMLINDPLNPPPGLEQTSLYRLNLYFKDDSGNDVVIKVFDFGARNDISGP